MMLFYFVKNKIEYFLDPPPKKGEGIRTIAMWLKAHVFAYTCSLCHGVLIGRDSGLAQRNPFIKIIIQLQSLFHAHNSDLTIFFIQKKAHLVSTQRQLTLR